MPVSSPRIHRLRRTLSTVFLFEDLTRARQSAENVITVAEITKHLKEDDRFRIHNHTEYDDLLALVNFLDITIDDAARGHLEDAAARKEFDSGIDGLIKQVETMERKIDSTPGSSQTSRIDTKTALQCLQHRLTHAVRTRPPRKTRIFDSPSPKKDTNLPKQQNFMKGFLASKPRPLELGVPKLSSTHVAAQRGIVGS